jgi:acetyl-CoA C-acetyltransferase
MKSVMKVETGGTVSGSACISAVHHVAAGACEVSLASSTAVFPAPPDDVIPRGAFLQASLSAGMHPIIEKWCSIGAIGLFSLMANSYIRLSGCTEEAVAKCRAKASRNAAKNPYAHLRGIVTVEDVLKSPMLMSPLRHLHMCPISEGSTALIFASEDVAEKITKKPVWVKDVVSLHGAQYWGVLHEMFAPKEKVALPSLVKACDILYKRNGITNPARELDVVEIYEPCTHAELVFMENMRLCEPNEAWKLADRGATEIDGEMPVNPSGGVTCTNGGMPSTMQRFGEVALQIRGDAGEHQVPGDVRLGLATGFGGSGWTPLMLLSKDK